MTKDDIRQYILDLLAPLAPGVECNFSSDEMGTLFTVIVPEGDDKGRVIGKKGETANAIRHIVTIVGFQANIRASVKIA